MKPSHCIGALLLVPSAFLAASGDGSYENLVKEMLGTFDQINKVLATVRDKGSADAARPQLKQAATKIMELRKQADEKQPNKEEKDRLAKEYASKFAVVFKKLKEESSRVKGVPGGGAVLEELAILRDPKDKEKDKKDGK